MTPADPAGRSSAGDRDASADRPTVHLVDASPYVFRAFYSLPDTIRDPEGEPANAVLGFAGFVLRLVETERPTHLAICFDGSLTTSFRNELYPEYKAHRDPPPAELEAQVDDCREMAEALGATTFVDDRFEADDFIATLTERCRDAGAAVVVVSSDKDLMQLVGSSVELLDFARGERYGPRQVEAKLGVRPRQVPDYLGLVGDSVDNIPGVAGIGPKTATVLLAEFDDLDAVLADPRAIEELPLRGARSVAAKLLEGRDRAAMSKRLAVLSLDAPVGAAAELGLDELRFAGPDRERLEALCERLGFERLAERVRRVFETD
ncbi:MAG: 5'-3' exonuclease H3TH domain-containing protein [Thermoanaerobaculia bacterium]|nr:5'-3' exonuclease H3TH domain-containing protein [Thermoanaerobaculia bacterium]